MKIKDMVGFSHNLLKTHVTIKTPHGEYTESVINLRRKVNDPYVLAPVKRMFQEMLNFHDGIQS